MSGTQKEWWDTELDLSKPRICEQCGEEVQCGLMFAIEHAYTVCKKNAPNESIQTHYEMERFSKMQKDDEESFAPIWKQMTSQEQIDLTMYGMPMAFGPVGSVLWNQYYDFKNKMIEKYKVDKYGRVQNT